MSWFSVKWRVAVSRELEFSPFGAGIFKAWGNLSNPMKKGRTALRGRTDVGIRPHWSDHEVAVNRSTCRQSAWSKRAEPVVIRRKGGGGDVHRQ